MDLLPPEIIDIIYENLVDFLDRLFFCISSPIAYRSVQRINLHIEQLNAIFSLISGSSSYMNCAKKLIPNMTNNFSDRGTVSKILYKAARNGNLAITEWMLKNGAKPNNTVHWNACQSGNLELILSLGMYRCPYHNRMFEGIAASGNIKTMKFLLKSRRPALSYRVLESAASHGHLEMVKFLREKGCPRHYNVLSGAVRGGNKSVIKYLLQDGCPFHETVVHATIKCNNLQAMKFFVKKGLLESYTHNLCEKTAQFGELDMLQYFREQGKPWGNSTVEIAAGKSKFDMVKWSVENGCPYNKSIVYQHAVLSGVRRRLIESITKFLDEIDS